MDWTLAIERNHAILLRNVAWLFTWLRLEVGESIDTLPRFKRLAVLFVLRPSEAACRRLVLITVLVRRVVAPLIAARVARSAPKHKTPREMRVRTTALPFKLIDPRKNFDLFPDKPKYVSGPGPWVTDMWSDDPIFDRSALYAHQERMNRPLPTPEDCISAKALCRRMNALMGALSDLDGQALRMAKLQARMKRVLERTGKMSLQVLRPGLPPGYRQRKKQEVDEVLVECHQMALMAQHELKPPDTS